jgi:hypothetical protein
MSRECDDCGMSEDHYGKNTMPLHRVPIDKNTSTTICDDCAQTGLRSGNLTNYQMKNLPASLKGRS